jgi:hypothetical protein
VFGLRGEYRLTAAVLERQRGIEQRGLYCGESIEVLDLRAVRDRMRNQSHPEASHRVVVARGVTMHGRKVLDSDCDSGLGLDQAISAHSQPGQPQVVAVMELRAGQLGAEEGVQERIVGEHWRIHLRKRNDPAGPPRWLRRLPCG